MKSHYFAYFAYNEVPRNVDFACHAHCPVLKTVFHRLKFRIMSGTAGIRLQSDRAEIFRCTYILYHLINLLNNFSDAPAFYSLHCTSYFFRPFTSNKYSRWIAEFVENGMIRVFDALRLALNEITMKYLFMTSLYS